MDPNLPTAQDWKLIEPLLWDLWLFVLFMVGFAGNLMLSHAVIPSLVGTHHIPQRVSALRPFLYVISGISYLIALFVFYNLVTNVGPVLALYPKQWI